MNALTIFCVAIVFASFALLLFQGWRDWRDGIEWDEP